MRYDPIVPGELDRERAVNTMTLNKIISKNATGRVVHSFMVEVERANLGELRNKYSEKFKRPYDADAGLHLDTWVKK